MKESKDVVACVIDHGLFFPWAQMLSRGFKKTYYHTPWERSFPLISECVVGDGFSTVERCDDIFDVIDKCDLFVFPDIGFSGFQLHLEKMGKAVWGSRRGDELEIYREYFMSVLKDVGLPVAPHRIIKGITNLKIFLKDSEDKYIKVSKFRGNFETFHYRSWREDELKLNKLETVFGALKEEISFIVVDPIETDIEDGYDGYCIDGKFPRQAMHGLECKDKGYVCSVQDYDELPEQIRQVNDAFAAKLAEFRYRNKFSTEVRITESESYFIDPTCRCGSPPSQVEAEMVSNWCDIVWHGANGELVEMNPVAEFGVQTVIKMKRESSHWSVADIPEEIRRWVKCGNCCEVDGRICFPPDEPDCITGWVVGIGDSVQDAIDHLKENADKLPDGMTTDVQALASLLHEMESAKELGIVVAEKIPEPSSVVEK